MLSYGDVFSGNVALGKPARQSRTDGSAPAARAVDGSTNPDFWRGDSCTFSKASTSHNWWAVDLQEKFYVHSVTIFNRDTCKLEQLLWSIISNHRLWFVLYSVSFNLRYEIYIYLRENNLWEYLGTCEKVACDFGLYGVSAGYFSFLPYLQLASTNLAEKSGDEWISKINILTFSNHGSYMRPGN